MYTPFLANTTNQPFGIEVVSAEGIYLVDRSGKKYIDLISGIAVSNLGHQNQHIKSALLDQLNKHLHIMVFGEFSQEIQNKLAQKLATLFYRLCCSCLLMIVMLSRVLIIK